MYVTLENNVDTKISKFRFIQFVFKVDIPKCTQGVHFLDTHGGRLEFDAFVYDVPISVYICFVVKCLSYTTY